MAILLNLTDLKWLHTFTDYLLVRNITAWMLGSEKDVLDREALGGPFQFGDYPSELHGFLVLTAYLVVLVTATFWRFQRRDVAGASAG